jgi:hypothetical protein
LNKEDIFEAARSIRPYLNELIPAEAGQVDNELAAYLNEGAPAQNTNLLLATLRRYEPTREWVSEFLGQRVPPAVTRAFEFQPPPGDPAPVSATKYVCPQGDYCWYRVSIGRPVPNCPTHGLALVVAP